MSHHNFLIEVASWGVIVIANGTPRGGGSTSAQTMTNAITWAVNNAGKGAYANMVTSRLAAAGSRSSPLPFLPPHEFSWISPPLSSNSGERDEEKKKRLTWVESPKKVSCGGIEAYAQAFDPRVTAIGIYNSGQYDAGGTQATVPRITKPIFFFMGGPSDIAYENVSILSFLLLLICSFLL